MKFKYKSTKGTYLSDIPNFILIEHKRAEIQSREVDRESYRKNGYWKMENGSILAPQMRHILASLESVASAADGIQKEA